MQTALIALGIFAMRLVDVSIGTMRIVMLVRRRRVVASVLGFFESLTWTLAAGLVLTNLDSPAKVLAYAGGFGAGTLLGGTIERWLALGHCMVRVVTMADEPGAAAQLRAAGFGVTVVNAEGLSGDVRISFTVAPRRRCPEILEIVAAANPDAFVTIEDTSEAPLAARKQTQRK